MVFHIISLFPSAFSSYLGESILKRAIEDKKIKVKFYDPKDYEPNKKWRVDDKPYGGGPGMVIRPEPVVRAITSAKKNTKKGKVKIIWFSPSGKKFTNDYAKNSAKKYSDIILVCGRYEGIDARVKKVFRAEELSVGPFVLTGGELPAMIVIDVVSRQIRGVLGNFDSLEESRISSPDVYTRPETFVYKGKKYKVPKVFLSGHRAKIDEWREKLSTGRKD